MDTVVRINKVEIQNIKNVRYGKFEGNYSYDVYSLENEVIETKQADMLGFYGQNGSGKTAVVESLALLKQLLNGEFLPSVEQRLIYSGEKKASLSVQFTIILNNRRIYTTNYQAILVYSDLYMGVLEEKLTFKQNIKGSRPKSILQYKEQVLSKVPLQKEKDWVKAHTIAIYQGNSMIFNRKLQSMYFPTLPLVEAEIIQALQDVFAKNLLIIPNEHTGVVGKHLLIPTVEPDMKYESIDLNENQDLNEKQENINILKPFIIKETEISALKQTLEINNMILGRLIPNLHIELLEYGLEKDERSSVYNARVELLSCKDDRRLPLRVESAGTLKIFSVISALIAFYKQENACVVIDELDAGIFEYLLGEILESLQSEAKGQLIFTSHNLRALEVLPIKNIWFTTVNAHNRYTQMKYVREVNNTRNRYYEAIQVDGLPEKLYVNTDISSIKRAFRKAGRVND